MTQPTQSSHKRTPCNSHPRTSRSYTSHFPIRSIFHEIVDFSPIQARADCSDGSLRGEGEGFEKGHVDEDVFGRGASCSGVADGEGEGGEGVEVFDQG